MIYQFNIGQFKCANLNDSANPRTAVSFWPSIAAETVLREVSAAGYNPDALENSFNILLIQTSNHKVLVDTGLGVGRSSLLDNLREVGVAPDEIDRIIITHCHGDHIGGIIGADGELIFPNARYSLWKTEWEYWLDVAQKSDDPNNPARRNLLPIQDKVDVVDQEIDIVPGICAIHAPGHTVGHMGLLIESSGERLLHMVDAAHHQVQTLHPDWSPHFDYQPEVAAATRRALFGRAARENLWVLTYHFAYPGLGHVVERNGGWHWDETKA
jgi:glyoxylase-like metal-dependent hydrolase (beta-lactamase superfamily II)